MKITVSFEPMDKKRRKEFSDRLSEMIADYLKKKGKHKEKSNSRKKEVNMNNT